MKIRETAYPFYFIVGDIVEYKGRPFIVKHSDGAICRAEDSNGTVEFIGMFESFKWIYHSNQPTDEVFFDVDEYRDTRVNKTLYFDSFGNVHSVIKSSEDEEDKVIALLYAIAKSHGYSATDIYRACYPEAFREERKAERLERKQRKLEQKKNKEIIDFAKTFVYPMNRERTRMMYKSLKAKGIEPYYIENNCIIKANMNTCYKYGKDTIFHKNGYIQPIQQLKEYFNK